MADKKEFIAYLPEDDHPENDILEEISQKSGASSDEVRGVLWRKKLQEAFPDLVIEKDPLPISIACHTGEGALGVGIMRDTLS